MTARQRYNSASSTNYALARVELEHIRGRVAAGVQVKYRKKLWADVAQGYRVSASIFSKAATPSPENRRAEMWRRRELIALLDAHRADEARGMVRGAGLKRVAAEVQRILSELGPQPDQNAEYFPRNRDFIEKCRASINLVT